MFYYNKSVTKNGGIAQLARASGSYPAGRRFKSHYRYHFRPGGQAVKTPPFHGGNTSSILVRVTKKIQVPKRTWIFLSIAKAMAYHHALACISSKADRRLCISSHRRCVSKTLLQWWYATVTPLMIYNSLRNWWYTTASRWFYSYFIV